MFSPNRLILIFLFLIIFDFLIWGLVIFDKPNRNLELYFLDVGQGDGEFAVLPGGPKILIDGGPNNKVIGEVSGILSATDRYIDLIILSHPQLDHFAGLIDIVKRYKVGAFIWNGRSGTSAAWNELVKVLNENRVPVVILGAGDKISYLDSKLNILSPDKNYIKSKDLNDTALVTLLTSQNSSALFTGDIGKKVEDYLARIYNANIDVLKVAHHGSKFSTNDNFLNSMKPKISVIEVGKNSYGHPTKIVLDKLASVGSQIFRTDMNGTVKLAVENGEINIFKKK